MKNIFLLLLLFLSIFNLCVAQKGLSNNDRLTSLESKIVRLEKSNDSLATELGYFKRNEGQYIGLFQTYVAHSDSILAVVAGLIAIGISAIGYFAFYGLDKKFKKQTDDLEGYIATASSNMRIVKFDLYGFAAGNSLILSKITRSSRSYLLALQCALQSIDAIYKYYEHRPSDGSEDSISCMVIAECLENLEKVLREIPTSLWDIKFTSNIFDNYNRLLVYDGKNVMLVFSGFSDQIVSSLALTIWTELLDKFKAHNLK